MKKEKSVKRILSAILVCVTAAGSVAGCQFFDGKATEEEETFEFTPSIEIETKDDQRSYAVSTSSDIATTIGMSVLESGGNAVDAAIAVAYALSVVEPHASGLGGSGGMLIYDTNTEECVFYDYRACAGSVGYSPDLVAVPGFVAGMEAVHNDYGTLPMADLLEPAVEYAEKGFTVNETLDYRLRVAEGELSGYSELHNEDGDYLSTGDTMYNTELASVLRSIQEEGASVFYTGYIAEDITENCSLTMEDMASYQVRKEAAVQGSFEGYTVYSAAAPLSGVTLIQMLEMAEKVDIAEPEKDVNTYASQLKKITNVAYSDRYDTIADPSYSTVDEQSLVSSAYIDQILDSEVRAAGSDNESTETTSFSIIDSDGLVVTSTNTLSSFWGSRILVDGIFLNNTNSNFSSSSVNQYEPGKRSRTFTAPTIILGDDGYIMAIGTPGGNNIPSRLFNVIVDILKFGTDPQDAVSKTGVLYKDNDLYVEVDKEGNTWFNTSQVADSVISRDTGYWWGSVSLAGYSDSTGAFAAYDYRRGATKAGVYNPE